MTINLKLDNEILIKSCAHFWQRSFKPAANGTLNSEFKKLAVTCLNEYLYFLYTEEVVDSFLLLNNQNSYGQEPL